MIDVVCDEHVLPFYRQLGAKQVAGAAWRDATAVTTAET